MVLLNGNHLGDTIIAGNKYLIGDSIMRIRDSFLYYLQIGLHNGDAEYRI